MYNHFVDTTDREAEPQMLKPVPKPKNKQAKITKRSLDSPSAQPERPSKSTHLEPSIASPSTAATTSKHTQPTTSNALKTSARLPRHDMPATSQPSIPHPVSSIDQFLDRHGLSQTGAEDPFVYEHGDCMFAALAYLINKQGGAQMISAAHLRYQSTIGIQTKMADNAQYRGNMKGMDDYGGIESYLARMEHTYAEQIAQGWTPLEGDYIALESICRSLSLNVNVVNASKEQLTAECSYGSTHTPTHHLLWFPGTMVPTSSGYEMGLGHYVPLKHNPRANTLAPSRMPRPLLGTETHFTWKPCFDSSDSHGSIPSLQSAVTLFNLECMQNCRLPLPDQYIPSFGLGSFGAVQREKMQPGQMLSESLTRRILQIFSNRIDRQRASIHPPPPTTLILDNTFVDKLYRDTRTTRDSTTITPAAAGVYSFDHGWKHLKATTKSYPRRRLLPLFERPQSLSELEILQHENILLPFVESLHFVLIHIRPHQGTICMMDSKPSAYMERERLLQHLLTFFQTLESKAYPNTEPIKQWQILRPPASLPKQSNGVDCGVFLVAYAGQIMAGHYACDQLKQQHMRSLRINLLNMLVEEPPTVDSY